MSRLLLKTLLLLLLILGAGLLAHFMVRHPGYVMLAWGQWMFEITLWGALGLVLILAVLAMLTVRVLRGVNPVMLARKYRDRRDRRVARVATGKAVMSWLDGDDAGALAALQQVVKAGGSERLPRILALVPAQQSEDWPAAVETFKEADPDMSLVADALTAQKLAQTRETAALLELWQRQPGLQRIRKLQPDYWQALLDHGHAGKALEVINKTPNLHPADRERWQQTAALTLIGQACATSLDELTPLKTLPRSVRQKASVVAAESRCMLLHNQTAGALKKLSRALEKAPAPELLRCLLNEHIPASQALALAEQLKKKHGDSATLMLVLGELCEASDLMGKAEDYLNEAWRLEANRETGLALARFYEHSEQADRALAQYRELAQLGE